MKIDTDEMFKAIRMHSKRKYQLAENDPDEKFYVEQEEQDMQTAVRMTELIAKRLITTGLLEQKEI